MDITAKLTIAFSGAGILAGIISGFLPNAWLALLVAFIFLYASYKLTTYILKKPAVTKAPAAPMPGQAPIQSAAQPQSVKKTAAMKGFRLFFATLVKVGSDSKDTETRFWFWPYYIMWFIFWIITYTIILLW